MTGGVLHTGDGGSSDRRGTSYRRWWEQRQEGYFIPEMAGAVTGGILHTGDGGSGDRRGYFIPEMAGAVTGGVLHTGDGGSGDRRDASYRRWWEQ